METNPLKGTTGFKRIINAFGYSLQGFRNAWLNEAAFRQEAILVLVLLPLAVWLDVTTLERIVLIGVLAIVLIVELLNSAVEAAIDRIGPEHHELSGRAKDFGSAAVFVALTLTLYVWSAILYDNYGKGWIS